MEWLKKAAPYLVTALTGNVPALAAMAAKDLSGKLGVESSVEAVTEKLQTGISPEQMAEIKKIEADFKLRMKELGYQNEQELEKVAAADRKDARAREVATRDWTPKVLAVVITIGFFGILAYLITHGIPADGQADEALLILLGALGAAWGSIVNYYYGSSHGSSRKNELLGKKQE